MVVERDMMERWESENSENPDPNAWPLLKIPAEIPPELRKLAAPATLELPGLFRGMTAIYVGKGPSLVNFQASPSQVVATVNESCLGVTGVIDIAFFSDYRTVMRSTEAWPRIRRFVMPYWLHGDAPGREMPISSVCPPVPPRVYGIEDGQIPSTIFAIREAITARRIPFTDTATMGLYCLWLAGIKSVHCFGHDGGVGYAPGMPTLDASRDYTQKRRLLEFCCSTLNTVSPLSLSFDKGYVGDSSIVVDH